MVNLLLFFAESPIDVVKAVCNSEYYGHPSQTREVRTKGPGH